jgi:nitrite reductase (NADH) small subunit
MEENAMDGRWVEVCALSDITPGTGVAALLNGRQLAIIRTCSDQLFALGNYDPFSKACVIARGIIGDHNGTPKIASPMYKQSFDLRNGRCLEDPEICLGSYAVRVVEGRVEVYSAPAPAEAPLR